MESPKSTKQVDTDLQLVNFDRAGICYGGREVIRDLSFGIQRGRHLLVSGANGSGKTTLARALVGKARVCSGQMTIDYDHVTMGYVAFDSKPTHPDIGERHYYQQRFQSFDTQGLPTVREYLFTTQDQPSDLIDDLELREILDLEIIKLSSGQNRRLQIAKQLLRNPSLLLIDNLEVGLDSLRRKQIVSWLGQAIRKVNTTVVLFGHFDRIPTFIKDELRLPGGYDFQNKSSISSTLTRYFAQPSPLASQTAVEFRNVSISYRKQLVVPPLSWRVEAGEKWCIMGGNGSGKSSLMSLIYADHPQAYSNDVRIFDRRRGVGESMWQVKSKMGFTSPEIQRYFTAGMSVLDFISTGLTDTELPKALTDEQRQITEELMAHFGIVELLQVEMTTLADGIRRLAFLIRAVLKNPPLLILDEPFQGMSSNLVHACKRLLDQLLTPQHTLLFITHFEHQIPRCVDKVLYLSQVDSSRSK